MKFWQSPPDSVPKFHFGTPSNCQPKNEGCLKTNSSFANMQVTDSKPFFAISIITSAAMLSTMGTARGTTWEKIPFHATSTLSFISIFKQP